MIFDMKISSSLEDYLEAILEITEENPHAHTKDIAARLQVSMPSVTSALQGLAARGLIRYRPHSPVTLTSRGEEIARKILRRHRIMQAFFIDILKLEKEDASANACKMEHILNETVLARFIGLTEAIMNHPDCAELRDYLCRTMPETDVENQEDLLPLDLLPPHQNAAVVSVHDGDRSCDHYEGLGIVPGADIEVEEGGSLHDCLHLKLQGRSITLPRDEAKNVFVKF